MIWFTQSLLDWCLTLPQKSYIGGKRTLYPSYGAKGESTYVLVIGSKSRCPNSSPLIKKWVIYLSPLLDVWGNLSCIYIPVFVVWNDIGQFFKDCFYLGKKSPSYKASGRDGKKWSACHKSGREFVKQVTQPIELWTGKCCTNTFVNVKVLHQESSEDENNSDPNVY